MTKPRQSNSEAFRRHIEAIRAATDVVALVQECVPLTNEGSCFRGKSPFSEDRNPSLVVWPDSQLWRDFSAGNQDRASDCFGWIQAIRNCSFTEAVSELAERAGVPSRTIDPAAAKIAAEEQREQRWIEEVLTEYSLDCHAALTEEVRDRVLRNHYGFSDEIVDHFKIGLAFPGLATSLAERLGVGQERILCTGLIKHAEGQTREFFVGRLVFPYWHRGRVVYIRGRCINQARPSKNKYIGLPIYSAKNPDVSKLLRSPPAFNMDDAEGSGDLWIAEGVTDCIAAKQAGLRVISPAGVRFQKRHMPWLLGVSKRADRVIICPDQESNGAGMKGALATAKELYKSGCDVRLLVLPKAESERKIDLCSYARGRNSEEMSSLLTSTSPLAEVLIQQVPQESSGSDLAAHLRPAYQMLSGRSQIEVEAVIDSIHRRFGVSRSAIRSDLKREQKTVIPTTGPKSEELSSVLLRGSIREAGSRYIQFDRKGQPEAISNFVVRPQSRIVLEDDEVVVADLHTSEGRVVRGVRLPRAAWHSKDRFLAALPSIDLVWTGSSENVQALLGLVARQPVEQVRGSRQLGYFEHEGQSLWVTNDTLLSSEREGESPTVVYAGDDHNIANRLSYKAVNDETVRSTAESVLPKLWQINRPVVTLPAIGWFFAALIRPRVQRVLHRFPFLSIWGTQGCGKTSLISDVLWPLVGVVSSEPMSVTQTDYPTIRALTSTSSIPIFFDEFKPADMRRDRSANIQRVIRRVYGWEAEDRGRSDLSLDSRKLTAPVVLAGETFPDQPALLERMIPISLDKSDLSACPEFKSAFRSVVAANPSLLAESIVRFVLGRDTEADLRKALAQVTYLTSELQISDRVTDNLSVMVMGISMYREYAASLDVNLPEFDVGACITHVLSELGIGTSGQVKSGMDSFLEEVSELASMGRITHGEEYECPSNGVLALHLPGCRTKLLTHRRETGQPTDLPDLPSLSRMASENQKEKEKGYVRNTKRQVMFHSRDGVRRKRCVMICLDTANRALDLEDFPGYGSTASEVSESPTHPSHQTPVCVSVVGPTGSRKEAHP